MGVGDKPALTGLDRAANARYLRDHAQSKYGLQKAGEMAPWEHGQFAQGVTEALGPLGAVLMLAAIPGYQGYKAVQQSLPVSIGQHMYGHGATPSSLAEMSEAYKGMWKGAFDNAHSMVVGKQMLRGIQDTLKAGEAQASGQPAQPVR